MEGKSFYSVAEDHLNCPIGAYTLGRFQEFQIDGMLCWSNIIKAGVLRPNNNSPGLRYMVSS